MQFHEMDICQDMIFKLYTVYDKHEMIKLAIKPEKNYKYYRKCSNNFIVDCNQELDFKVLKIKHS